MVKQKYFFTLFPIYLGLSIDLLFWIVVDGLFLTTVKGFSLSQISSLSTISLFICIVFQYPFLRLIQKIGNTKSVQLGSFLLLVASILFTFGSHYATIVIGHIAYDVSFVFRNMCIVMLKNNLTQVGRQDDFVAIKTKCNMIYALVTTIISLISGFLFAFHAYLPMYLCIASSAFIFMLSLYLKDFSGYDKINKKREKTLSFSLRPYLLLCIVYGLFFTIIYIGQPDVKILLQETLLAFIPLEKASMTLSILLFISRLERLVSNYLYRRYYKKIGDKIALLLACLLFIGLSFSVAGGLLKDTFFLSLTLISIGYCLLLFVRDPFSIFVQDYLLCHCDKTHHQTIITYLEYACKMIEFSISICFTLLLLHFPMTLIIFILCLLSFVEFLLCTLLLSRIKNIAIKLK